MFYETCVFVEIFEIAITIRKFDRDYKVILEQYYNTGQFKTLTLTLTQTLTLTLTLCGQVFYNCTQATCTVKFSTSFKRHILCTKIHTFELWSRTKSNSLFSLQVGSACLLSCMTSLPPRGRNGFHIFYLKQQI